MPRGRDFSFSGLKTALLYDLRERDAAEVAAHRADIAASYQAAIVRQLVRQDRGAAPRAEGLRQVAIAGGVAANSGLRRALTARCEAEGLRSWLPPVSLCTDNAGHDRPGGRLPAGARLAALPGLDAFASDAEAKAAPRRAAAARRVACPAPALRRPARSPRRRPALSATRAMVDDRPKRVELTRSGWAARHNPVFRPRLPDRRFAER